MSERKQCLCGCHGNAVWLVSGRDFTGEMFKDEPACEGSTQYMEDASAELGGPVAKRPVEEAP